MAYLPEPPHAHGSTARTGVLLVNLGTPDEATAPAVRRYLAEFLWDPRVVEVDPQSAPPPSLSARRIRWNSAVGSANTPRGGDTHRLRIGIGPQATDEA